MAVYIQSGAIISPQHTHDAVDFPAVIHSDVSDRLNCIEPEYRTLINPLLLRRMPRILKMGLGAAQLCISRSECTNPDGIIVGTGLGCLDNLEKFLLDVIDNNEEVTSVLPFINSTHNAVAAQIAMLLKNQKYNTTYCHRNFSFETALLDGMMLVEENRANHILVGGIDECTGDYILIHRYLGTWKDPLNNLELFSSPTPGTIAGEGAGFFMLGGKKSENTGSVRLVGVHTFLTPELVNEMEITARIMSFLSKHSMDTGDIDGVIMGFSGDSKTDSIYNYLAGELFGDQTILGYKHLCGEYYTSGAFALWLASVIAGKEKIPEILLMSSLIKTPLKTILIYNQLNSTEHSLICLKYDRL